MSSVSGLSRAHRTVARDRTVQAAMLGLRNRSAVHYTQGRTRWQGIGRKLNARKGQFPRYADCSSYATWCLWNGLSLPFQVRDVVNGAAWQAGFTGTMLNHGKPVRKLANVLRGDLVLYGAPGTAGRHVAIVVGKKNGKPMVVSHGSEGGPYYVAYDYRPDVMSIRRYI